MPEGYKPSGVVWSTCRHSPVEWLHPRVTNPRLLVWSGFATLPPAGGVSACVVRGGVDVVGAYPPACPRVARTLGWRVEYLSALSRGVATSEGCKPSATRVEWFHHSCLLRVASALLSCPRVSGTLGEMCGVPVGTLLDSGDIRGLQTLGYSCGVVSPLWSCGVDVVPVGAVLAWTWWDVSPQVCPRVARPLGI